MVPAAPAAGPGSAPHRAPLPAAAPRDRVEDGRGRAVDERQPVAGPGSGSPHSAARIDALSVRSHGRSRSGRPKCP